MLTEPPSLPVAGRINLRTLKVLCVDASPLGLDILSQTLLGFGVDRIFRATSVTEAQAILKAETIDMVLCDADLAGESGNDFIRWLRLSRMEPNCHVPAFVITGHALEPEVINSRDCGSNFVVAKPLAPAVLMQRILWVAAVDRPFIESDSYTGPDRRFKHQGMPPEAPQGRRKSDSAAALGAPTESNISQEELENLVKPQKVSL